MTYYESISQLSQLLKKAIVFYDIESTTFRGADNFGITDVYCVVVPVEGDWLVLEDLINPENAISTEASNITGITQKMVREHPNWGAYYAKTFQAFLNNCYIAGFKNNSFDNHAVRDECNRYGAKTENAKYTFDVRTLYHRLMPTESQKGKLVEIAKRCGVAQSEAHRSRPDVLMTLGIMDYLIKTFGVEKVAALIKGDKVVTAKEIAKYIKSRKNVAIHQVFSGFKQANPLDVLFEIGVAVDERLVDPELFAVARAQEKLSVYLPLVVEDKTCVSLKQVKTNLKINHQCKTDWKNCRCVCLNPKNEIEYCHIKFPEEN